MGLFDRFKPAASATVNRSADTSEQDAVRLIDQGNAIEEQGRPQEALQCYEAAIRLAPNLARGYLNRGNILLETGDTGGALAAYADALTRNPQYAGAHYNMGNAYLR